MHFIHAWMSGTSTKHVQGPWKFSDMVLWMLVCTMGMILDFYKDYHMSLFLILTLIPALVASLIPRPSPDLPGSSLHTVNDETWKQEGLALQDQKLDGGQAWEWGYLFLLLFQLIVTFSKKYCSSVLFILVQVEPLSWHWPETVTTAVHRRTLLLVSVQVCDCVCNGG